MNNSAIQKKETFTCRLIVNQIVTCTASERPFLISYISTRTLHCHRKNEGEENSQIYFSSLLLVDWLIWTLVLLRRGSVRVNIVVVCAFGNSSKTTVCIFPCVLLHFTQFWLYMHVIPHTHTHKKNGEMTLNYYITVAPPLKAVCLHSCYIKPTFHDPFNSKLYPLKFLTF